MDSPRSNNSHSIRDICLGKGPEVQTVRITLLKVPTLLLQWGIMRHRATIWEAIHRRSLGESRGWMNGMVAASSSSIGNRIRMVSIHIKRAIYIYFIITYTERISLIPDIIKVDKK
jgi:hypothetical protein